MKLNCKRIDFTYTPGEEIFAFPEESGLPFLFDVEKELTADPNDFLNRLKGSKSPAACRNDCFDRLSGMALVPCRYSGSVAAHDAG